MPNTFAKLNLKDQEQILVVNAPQSFEPEIASLKGVTVVRHVNDAPEVLFSLVFVTTEEQLDSLARTIAAKAPGDAVVWFAYPKKSSKKYKSEINRDSSWRVFGQLGFEGVRQVAIDEDWSALRLRRVKFIQQMSRDPKRAMTSQGKARASKK